MSRLPVAATTLFALFILVTFSVAPGFSTSPRGRALPVDKSHPFMGGTTRLHHTLQAGTGSWRGRNVYSFQWKRCNSRGNKCEAIKGATGSFYSIGNGDTGHTLRISVTAHNEYGSRTATSRPKRVGRSSTGSSATNGSVTFDGRAKQMRVFSESGSPPNVVQTQDPANVWSCLCFTNNDVTLASNNTFGKDFHVAVTTGDTNPWGGSDTIDGAGQMSIRRNNDLGKWDWWAFAIKIPAWQNVSDLRFANLVSLGYQTSQGSQVGFGLTNQNGTLNWSIDQNAGYANNPTGWAAGTVAYTQGFQPVVYGQWTEFVLGVKVATDDSGRVAVYSRPVGGTWNQVFTHSGATELYGVTPNGTFAQDGSNWPTVIDKLGLYFGTYSNGKYTQTVDESGLTRSSDLTTAESTLP